MSDLKEWNVAGDHRLLTVPTALTEVTFYLTSTNTSANDTSTSKYFDNVATSGTQFNIVADQAIQLMGLNGTDFTDAVTIAANASYQESMIDNLTAVKVKTTVNNTQISVRVRVSP